MQERGRSGTSTLGFRSRSCVCGPWMRCGIDPDKLSVGQSNHGQDGSKPMVGTSNRSMARPMSDVCSLSTLRVKRTYPLGVALSAYDPKRA